MHFGDNRPLHLDTRDSPGAVSLTRRAALGTMGVAALCSMAPSHAADEDVPVTGDANADLEGFDRLMTSFVRERKIPGAALAVARGRKVVYSRGFGHADVDTREPVQPEALFRIASVSKPITAVTVLRLAEQGRVRLADKVRDFVKLDPHLEPGATYDRRWDDITLLHLLQHTGGWDRERSFDPIDIIWKIAKSLGIEPPILPEHIVRYMLGKPLDFDPGQRHAYSNLGYLLLGRVIEAATGEPYESHVRKTVLEPLGIRTMRLGRARLELRAAGEVKYYDSKKRTGPALTGQLIGEPVAFPYGAANFEGYEAHGGWIGSAVDLVRFAAAFDDPAHCPLLNAASIRTMWQRPEGAAGFDADGKPRDTFYGCGWKVRPVLRATGRGSGEKTDLLNAWHSGLIFGSSALLVRRWDHLTWAVLFNTDRDSGGQVPAAAIDPLLHPAADAVKVWPA
jgi:N-acyl-D-amino-acid deacylase